MSYFHPLDLLNRSFLFKSNIMQPCLSSHTLPRVIELKTIVLYCRRNARFPVHSSPPRKLQKCAAVQVLIRRAGRINYDEFGNESYKLSCSKSTVINFGGKNTKATFHQRAYRYVIHIILMTSLLTAKFR